MSAFHSCCRCRCWLLLLLLLPAGAATAQRSHAPLPLSDSLDFPALLEQALRQAPALQEDPVRRQQALDWVETGRSWLAGRPSLNLNFYDDAWLDDRGQVEVEYGVQVPLWRPGERAGIQELGRQYEAQVPLWLQALTLELAGQLRTVLADIAEAEVLLEQEREATASAGELLRVTTILHDNGSVPRLDLLQAETLLLAQRGRALEAEAALVDAEIEYGLLTGLEVRPAVPHTEIQSPVSELAEVEASHPTLRYLDSDIDLATASIRQYELSARGNPQLGLGSRRERGDRFTPYTDSVNVTLQIPLGGKSYVNSQTSAARRTKVDAEVQYLETRRALERALHEAEHELFLTGQSLPLAEQQEALATARQEMAETAFGEGEIGLVQLLPALQEARTARRALALLRLREQRLIATYNQILGVLP